MKALKQYSALVLFPCSVNVVVLLNLRKFGPHLILLLKCRKDKFVRCGLQVPTDNVDSPDNVGFQFRV